MYQLFPFLCYLPTQYTREIKRGEQIRETISPPEYRAHQESYIPGTTRDIISECGCWGIINNLDMANLVFSIYGVISQSAKQNT